MIVTCPSCQKRYLIDPQTIPLAGRTVRCAACAHTWLYHLPNVPEAWEPEVTGEPVKVRRWSWVIYAVVVLGTIAALGLGRESLVSWFPKTYSLYHMVGLKTYPRGYQLEISQLESEQVWQDQKAMLAIKGAVSNPTQTVQRLPKLQINYATPGCQDKTKGRCQRMAWTYLFAQDRLLPGESIKFTTLPHALPPEGAVGQIELSDRLF